MSKPIDPDVIMLYDPETGAKFPFPSQADQYRVWHGKVAWLYNPWTGNKRNAKDIGTDPLGHLIVPSGVKPVYQGEFNV